MMGATRRVRIAYLSRVHPRF